MTTTVVALLDSLRAHLTEFELPELCSVHVTRYGPNVTAQLASRRESPEIASALLAWADTLTGVTTEAWLVPGDDSVHLSVLGQLPRGVWVRCEQIAESVAELDTELRALGVRGRLTPLDLPPTSGIHVGLSIMIFPGVGTGKGAPDLGECGLSRSA
jgi:hypothetical protein